MSQPTSFKRLYSYKQQRIKSSKKLDLSLSLSLTTPHDLDNLSTTIQNNISRRMSQIHSSTQSQPTSKPKDSSIKQLSITLGNESFTNRREGDIFNNTIRQSMVSPKIMEKYSNGGIVEVSEDEGKGSGMEGKENEGTRFSKKKSGDYKSIGNLRTGKVALGYGGKMGLMGIKRKDSNKINKGQVTRVMKKVEGMREEIEKMGLVKGEEISILLSQVISKLKQE